MKDMWIYWFKEKKNLSNDYGWWNAALKENNKIFIGT